MTSLEKLIKAKQEAMDSIQKALENGEDVSRLVSISFENSKMGKVASVSLLPILTCPARCNGTCGDKCYAKKIALIRPVVMRAYARNTAIAKLAPVSFWEAVERAMAKVPYFRFHVSGDIPNGDYLHMIHFMSMKYPSCQILCFTKKYELVNEYLKENRLPNNLHILFSGWSNLKPENPYNLPETTVYAKDEDIKPEWTLCGGNCLDCAQHGTGCWNAKKGETIAFKIH